MKVVTTMPVKSTTGRDIAAGVEFEEPDDARAEFWLRTGACVRPGTPQAKTAMKAAADGVPYDLASGAVRPEDLLSHRVSIDGVDLKKLADEHGAKVPPKPPGTDDRLPPVPPRPSDDGDK